MNCARTKGVRTSGIMPMRSLLCGALSLVLFLCSGMAKAQGSVHIDLQPTIDKQNAEKTYNDVIAHQTQESNSPGFLLVTVGGLILGVVILSRRRQGKPS